MPLLSNCCFFFDLKVGTKIIGVIKLIGAIMTSLTLAVMLVFLLFVDSSVDLASNIHEVHRNSLKDDDYADVGDQPKQIFDLVKEHLSYVKIAFCIVLTLGLLSVITSSMLIHGVRRDRRGLLLPFITQEVLNIVIFIALDISVAVIFGVPDVLIGLVLGVAGGCIIELYFLLVVISQYQALGVLRMHEEISMK